MTYDTHPEASADAEALAESLHEYAVNQLGLDTDHVLFSAPATGPVTGRIGPTALDETTQEDERVVPDDVVSVPSFAGEAPVNYRDFRESVALALSGEGIPQETITAALRTVDDAVVNNETELVWSDDLAAD